MRAAVVKEVNNIAVQDIAMPEMLHGTALIKVHYAGLCGPTDDAILKGLHPRAKFPRLWQLGYTR